MKNQELSTELYLDLMKRVLCFTLWPEPATKVRNFNNHKFPRKQIGNLLMTLLRRYTNLHLATRFVVSDSRRELGEVWPVCAHTMVGMRRLSNIQTCLETVIDENIPGDVIETGVWRGGTCIFMKAILKLGLKLLIFLT